MATNKNINECGWFYHAPAKREEKPDPAPTPYISQIPGLSEYEDDQPTQPQGLYFKDTDSKFIRLSKQGGRKDLLVFKDNKQTENKEPQGYPKVDWFYLADNAREDAAIQEPKKPHQFLLPEYMVYDSYVPSCVEGTSPSPDGSRRQGSRVPYACDKQTIFQSEGNDVTDKRVKIPEARQPGFGVRNSKPVKVQQHTSKTPNGSNMMKDHGRIVYFRITEGDKLAQMHHILAYDYERQWHEEMKKSHDQQAPAKLKGEHPIPSEYDDKYGKKAAPKKTSPAVSPTSRRGDSAKKQTTQNTESEMFKLSN
ncbi:hypothetical protein LOTGIDRAFT_205260 [Lottia gigantea]|uniref:Uncharacterized protein n=1 Tax=Lottia gigantea TaxID=225164 RepID=V4A5K7_LOTGI|nr:hypothetical protein LOTGIDRAFT_205260 [Lottia gigantea]ESO99208.1 hypothetical protein LOTGIDRAFT_205260 [Lottia gigantea]